MGESIVDKYASLVMRVSDRITYKNTLLMNTPVLECTVEFFGEKFVGTSMVNQSYQDQLVDSFNEIVIAVGNHSQCKKALDDIAEFGHITKLHSKRLAKSGWVVPEEFVR